MKELRGTRVKKKRQKQTQLCVKNEYSALIDQLTANPVCVLEVLGSVQLTKKEKKIDISRLNTVFFR